jgi:hypothetical protein
VVQLGCVDQAHEAVADPGAILRLVEERVLAVEDGLLQCPFTDRVIQWRTRSCEHKVRNVCAHSSV